MGLVDLETFEEGIILIYLLVRLFPYHLERYFSYLENRKCGGIRILNKLKCSKRCCRYVNFLKIIPKYLADQDITFQLLCVKCPTLFFFKY